MTGANSNFRFEFSRARDCPACLLTRRLSDVIVQDMNVRLTPDQEAFIRQGIERGEYRDSTDAVREALLMWEERQRSRSEIRLALEESEADIAASRYRDYTDETLPQLAEEIAREARESRD